jgi:hypothetical protein
VAAAFRPSTATANDSYTNFADSNGDFWGTPLPQTDKRCTGTLTARATRNGPALGTTKFSLTGGNDELTDIPLKAPAATQLARAGTLKVPVSAATQVQPSGKRFAGFRTVTLTRAGESQPRRR